MSSASKSGKTVALSKAVSGPARLQIGEPSGSSSVFFETDNIEDMHAAISTRGSSPSLIEKVNWIKMKMFEVRDPDGNILWFGQSYNVTFPERPTPMLEKALPYLPLDDVAAGVQYYCEMLGFHINYQQKNFAVLDRDEVSIVLIARTPRHRIGSASFYIRNADDLYAELASKGAKVQGEPVSHPWGLRRFDVLDLEGNELSFLRPFE